MAPLSPHVPQRRTPQRHHRMLFYARAYLYSSTRRVATKTVRSIIHAPFFTAREATSTSGADAQRSRNTSHPATAKKDAFSHRAGGIAEASEPGRRDGDVQKTGHVLYRTAADGALSGGGGQAGQVRSVCDTSWIVYSLQMQLFVPQIHA